MAATKKPAASPAASLELADVEAQIDRMTLGVASGRPRERLELPRFRRILLAYDASSGSRNALAWAADLGKRLGAHVTVVSVAPPPEALRALQANAAAWQLVGATFKESDEDAVGALKRADDLLRDRDVDHTVELQRGFAAAGIVGMAVSDASDLVILGSHGHGLGERLSLGSVGTAVKHHLPCSVLIARRPPPAKSVLLATDGSQRSSLAVQAGREIAGLYQAKMTLAHVIDVRSYGIGRPVPVARWRELAVQERMQESPTSRGLPSMVLGGPPARMLRKAAKDARADLIVVGSRGLGGLRSLTLGSVSDKLTHKADQSVLVVKPKAS